MNSQRKWMTSENDDISKMVRLMEEYKCDDDAKKMGESRVNSVPYNFFVGAAQSQRLPPLQPLMSMTNDVLKNISNMTAGLAAGTSSNSSENSKYRMIRRTSEFSQHLFPNKDPCSSSASSSNVKPLFYEQQQNKTDSQSALTRNSSLFTNHDGIIQVSLRNGIRIDITVENSIRLTSCSGQIVISISKTGDASALKHPNGSVQQFGKNVQIIANGGHKTSSTTRYANMSSEGISFTSNKLAETFVLDPIGTRKSRDYFPKLTGDNTSAVFLGASQYGSTCNDKALNIIQKATYKKCIEDDTEVINVNDYRIWQMRDGLVTVARISCPFKIRTSPKNCSLTLSTPNIHCTASSRDSPHLFVRQNDQSMHFDGGNFVVRYNGNSAGFDKNDYLIVY